MEEEFVADSEGEGGLELSPPGYGHPTPLDASFDQFQAQIDQPGQAIYSPSTISEFPSTLQTTAKQPFDSPIVDFTATTHSSIVKKTPSNKKSKVTTTEVLDLSSEEEIYVAPQPRKPPRQKAASPSESAYGEPAKPPGVKSRKKPDVHDGDIPTAKGNAKKPKKKPARANSEDEIISLNESENAMPAKKPAKKRKSNAKKKLDDDEETIPEAPKAPSKKRKSPDNDDHPVGKPSKKRKKNSPQIDDVENAAEDHIGKKTRKGRRVVPVSDEESADELLLTKDTPVEAKKFKSSTPRPMRKSESIPPEDNSAIVSAEDSGLPSPQVQQGKSESPPPPSESSTSMLPPPPQPAKPAPRLSTGTRPAYAIPKRGSISDLLRKTGLHTPLSSSKLTRKAGDRIAPLHATRTTPPPPPPPIPKPKKKVVDVDEDEDDFTGMTEKQIAKFLEEKKKKAWYSP